MELKKRLEGKKAKELKQIAKQLNIKGRSKLDTKEKLIRHINTNYSELEIETALDVKTTRRKRFEKRQAYWFLGVIGSIASVIGFILALQPTTSIQEFNKVVDEKLNPILKKLDEIRAGILAETIKARGEFLSLNETTISGLSTYDDSYISAVLDGIRNIAEKHMASEKEPTVAVLQYFQNLGMGEATSVFNFGDSLRLSWKTSIKGFITQEDIVRLDVFPNPKKRPTQSFTIIIKDFMVKSISKDFSIKQLDHLLEKSAFEIKTPVSLRDGRLEITCIYKKPNRQGSKVLNSKGIGVPSDKRLHKDRL